MKVGKYVKTLNNIYDQEVKSKWGLPKFSKILQSFPVSNFSGNFKRLFKAWNR